MKILRLILIALISLFAYACSSSTENGVTIQKDSWWRIVSVENTNQLNS